MIISIFFQVFLTRKLPDPIIFTNQNYTEESLSAVIVIYATNLVFILKAFKTLAHLNGIP